MHCLPIPRPSVGHSGEKYPTTQFELNQKRGLDSTKKRFGFNKKEVWIQQKRGLDLTKKGFGFNKKGVWIQQKREVWIQQKRGLDSTKKREV